MNRIKVMLINIAIAYITLAVIMTFMQRFFMYFPNRNLKEPSAYGLEMKSLRLATSDGINIAAWHSVPTLNPHPYPTVVFFHGNGGHLGGRVHKLRSLQEEGFGVLGVSYRGYGTSEGSPSEEGFYEDGRAAMSYLKSNGVREEDIILYGESLGSGTAVQLATEYSIRMLVLEAPYTSTVDVAVNTYWYLPVRMLMWDRFESLRKISRIKAPLFIIHGEKDEVIPVSQGRALFEAANEPKDALFLPDIYHNTIPFAPTVQKMKQLLAMND